MILRYIIHRLKGVIADFGTTQERHYVVVCHTCGVSLVLTEGIERQELELHFDTEEHKTRSRDNGQ